MHWKEEISQEIREHATAGYARRGGGSFLPSRQIHALIDAVADQLEEVYRQLDLLEDDVRDLRGD